MPTLLGGHVLAKTTTNMATKTWPCHQTDKHPPKLGWSSHGLFDLRFELRHVLVPAVVAHLLNHGSSGFEVLAGFVLAALGQEQAGVFEMAVNLEQPHSATRGDGHDLIEIAPGVGGSPG